MPFRYWEGIRLPVLRWEFIVIASCTSVLTGAMAFAFCTLVTMGLYFGVVTGRIGDWTLTFISTGVIIAVIRRMNNEFSKTQWIAWLTMAGAIAINACIAGFGVEFHGARRWVSLPGDLLLRTSFWSMALFYFGASITVCSPFSIGWRCISAFLLAGWGMVLSLLAMPDLVSVVLFCLSLCTLSFVANPRWKWPVRLAGLLPLLLLVVAILIHPYRTNRLRNWYLDRVSETDPTGAGWALAESRRVIDSAGWFDGSSLNSLGLPMRMDWYGLVHLAASFGKLTLVLAVSTLLSFAILAFWRAYQEKGSLLCAFWVAIASLFFWNVLLVCGAPFGWFPYVGYYSTPLLAAGEGTSLALLLAYKVHCSSGLGQIWRGYRGC